tara:strand:+ start:368 stop:553 length:186 start_codon:yes stop_codon:yes gene_type:complete
MRVNPDPRKIMPGRASFRYPKRMRRNPDAPEQRTQGPIIGRKTRPASEGVPPRTPWMKRGI